MWENAQSMLKSAMDDMELDYFEVKVKLPSYGPKSDIREDRPLVMKKHFLQSN